MIYILNYVMLLARQKFRLPLYLENDFSCVAMVNVKIRLNNSRLDVHYNVNSVNCAIGCNLSFE